MDLKGNEKNFKIPMSKIDPLDLPKEGTFIKGNEMPPKRGAAASIIQQSTENASKRVNVYMTFLKPIDKAFGLCYL